MNRVCIVALCSVVGMLACVAPRAALASGPDVAAMVEIRAQGRSLQARYTLPAPALRLPFKRDYSSELRQRVWKVRTPGVRFDGNALVGERPFTEVEISAEALVEPVPKDYAPLAPFSDGGVAVYTGLFDAGAKRQRTRFRFVPAVGERLVLFGRAYEHAMEWVSEPDGDGTYAYFGRSALVPSGAGLAVLDRKLPQWIRAEVDVLFPQLIDFYAQRFGRAAPFTPFVLFSFGDSDAAGTHSQGSVLPGLLYMRLDGSAWLAGDAESRRGLRWTLAHEAAHFWNLANRDPVGAQWMHEGSADVFAHRALRALGDGDDTELQRAYDDALVACLLGLDGKSVNAAERSGDDSVAYSCGLVIALYTEAALRLRDANVDLFDFWRALLDQAGDDGYTQDLYLATLALQSGRPKAATWPAHFADHELSDDDGIAAAFERVGMPLRDIEGEVGAASARRIYGRLMWQLMAADCGGGVSFETRRSSLAVHGSKACRTLKQDFDVRMIEGHALFDGARAAYGAAHARCQAREPVRLADDRLAIEVPCASLTPLPKLLRFPPAADGPSTTKASHGTRAPLGGDRSLHIAGPTAG